MKGKFLYFTLMAIAIMGVMTACDDDENGAVASDNCDEKLTLEDFQSYAYNSLVEQNFTKVASGADTLLQMTCGLESFNGENNTRYAIAENATNALSVFCSQFGYIINEKILAEMEGTGFAIPLGGYGYVKYLMQPTNPAAFATAEVKLKGMPYAMYIQYVPKSYVPNNSNGAYEQGTLLNIDGQLWLCTTAWGGGSTPGTLIRFVDRSDDLLQYRNDYYKCVYFQNDPVGTDPFAGLEYLLSSYEYKEDLYETVKFIALNNNNLRDAHHLLNVMNTYRDVALTPEEYVAMDPSLAPVYAKYKELFSDLPFFPFCIYCWLVYDISLSYSGAHFNTGYYSSGKDYHAACAHKLYKVELNYVTISAGSFAFKSSGRHQHEWGYDDLGKRYFKEDAPCLVEKKTFTSQPLPGAEVVWPTIAQ